MPGLQFTNKKAFSFSEVPGLTEAGWTEELEKRGRQDDERSFEDQCDEILSRLMKHENSWPFREAVDRTECQITTKSSRNLWISSKSNLLLSLYPAMEGMME